MKTTFDEINRKYGEKDMHESDERVAVYYANPYNTDTIDIVRELLETKKATSIVIIPADDPDEDYNLIKMEIKEE